jgi:ribosome-binding protein aMBF1 (putative translation factor)
MPNITISVPEALRQKMKRYPEVRWSEVVRKALTDYIARLEAAERGIISSDELAARLSESNLDVSSISLEKAIKHYERARKLEWKRFSTIQVRS